jgi:adenine-specific DNA-methyltransferase
MNKLDLQTPDFTSANISRLAELFPNCVTEKKNSDGTLRRAIDFDLLSQELSHDLVEGPQERYRLDWPGKRAALALANEPIQKTLRPARDESVNFDTTRNLYLEGDNLDALKLLQETYLGQVKMMYIDPPYNTGNDFIYDDDFSMSRAKYQESSGEVDEKGRALFDEEKWKQNSASNGRFHSEWLSMMYPRLKLARNLLREDGVVFISIDDNEMHNLRKICDEVFGAVNFVATIIWQKKYSTKSDSLHFSESHDYVLVYSRNLDCLEINGLERTEKQLSIYKNLDNDSRGAWTSDNLLRTEARDYAIFPIVSPNTGEHFMPPDGSSWRYNRDKIEQLIKENRIWFGAKGDMRPRLKRFLTDVRDSVTPQTFWSFTEVGHSDSAKKELTKLLGRPFFSTPKPIQLLHRIALISTSKSDIICDFYSGSATTAHAVMQLNAEDGGKRRHIMVQLPEPCDEKSEAFKAGYKTIAEIGKERIRRAGKKILSEWQAKQTKERPTQGDLLHSTSNIQNSTSPPDIGFRVLKVDSSNMADVYYQPDELTQDTLALHVDNLKPGRKPEDLLFQVLLDWGVDLALPVTEEKIKGRRVFFVADSGEPAAHPALAACFDTGLDEDFVKTLAKRAPLRAVFRDAGYASDAVKINIEQIFKALSPHTELKTL